MAMSGVKPSEACMTTYNDLQKSKKHRYVIFMIKDEKMIDVEKVCVLFREGGDIGLFNTLVLKVL